MEKDESQLIDKYFTNQLSAGEAETFQHRIETDKAFVKEFQLQQSLISVLEKEAKKEKLRASLTEVSEQYFKEDAPIGSTRRRWLVAASIAMLLAILAILYISLRPRPTLYQQFAEHPVISFTEMSTTTYDMSTAESAFRNGNYQVARTELKKYFSENTNDTLAYLFIGICDLEIDSLENATNIFREIEAGQSDFSELSTWYLGLSYLKDGNITKTRESLDRIKPGMDQYLQAQALIKKLN